MSAKRSRAKQSVLAVRFQDDESLCRFIDAAVKAKLLPSHEDAPNLRAMEAESLDRLGNRGVYLLTTDEERPGEPLWPKPVPRPTDGKGLVL